MKTYVSHSGYNALATFSCNPARQERRNITHAFPRAAVPNSFCHSQLQTRNAGASGLTNLPAALQWERFRATPRRPVFNDSCVKSSSHFSLVPILPTMWFCKSASKASGCFFCKPSSHYSPARFSLITLADRAPNSRKQKPYFCDPQKQLCPKKRRFSRPKVFSPEPVTSRVPDLLHFAGNAHGMLGLIASPPKVCTYGEDCAKVQP